MTTESHNARIELLSPDGYYTYFGIDIPTSDDAELDLDAIKKQYRRLSLRHHPDKPGGDADTFRILNRAQKVLSDQKLRQQYNLLGLDLHDDEDALASNGGSSDEARSSESGDAPESQGIIQTIANTALTVVIQFGVRISTYLFFDTHTHFCLVELTQIYLVIFFTSHDGGSFNYSGTIPNNIVPSAALHGLYSLSHSSFASSGWCLPL